jgi:hypothetical protein
MSDPQVSCLGKKRFETYKVARASQIHFSIAVNAPELQVYQCEHCRGFHIGRPIGLHKKKEPVPPLDYRTDGQKRHEAILLYQKRHKTNPPPGWDWQAEE